MWHKNAVSAHAMPQATCIGSPRVHRDGRTQFWKVFAVRLKDILVAQISCTSLAPWEGTATRTFFSLDQRTLRLHP